MEVGGFVYPKEDRIQAPTGHGIVLPVTHQVIPGLTPTGQSEEWSLYLGKNYGVLEPQVRVQSACVNSICATGIW